MTRRFVGKGTGDRTRARAASLERAVGAIDGS